MGSSVHTFTDQNFDAEVLQAPGTVLVEFMATWCGPCKQMAPTVEQVATETAGKAKVGKLNIDDAPETAKRYGVRSVPTVIVFKNGQQTDSHAGLVNKQTLEKLLGV
jgi:thioredoxin 1